MGLAKKIEFLPYRIPDHFVGVADGVIAGRAGILNETDAIVPRTHALLLRPIGRESWTRQERRAMKRERAPETKAEKAEKPVVK